MKHQLLISVSEKVLKINALCVNDILFSELDWGLTLWWAMKTVLLITFSVLVKVLLVAGKCCFDVFEVFLTIYVCNVQLTFELYVCSAQLKAVARVFQSVVCFEIIYLSTKGFCHISKFDS